MSSPNIFVPIPIQDAIARPGREEFRSRGAKDPLEGRLTDPWLDYFTRQSLLLNQSPTRIKNVALATQGASIAPTDMSGGTLQAGLYRITYYARITRAATTSSSLTITFDWTDSGVAQTYSGAAMTGNTTGTNQSGTIMILIDPVTPVRYSTTYASVGGTSMQYSLAIVLEQVLA